MLGPTSTDLWNCEVCEFYSVLAAITLLDYLHTQCHLMTPMALSNSEQVFTTAHFLPFALSFPDPSLLKLLSFPQAPVLCLPPSLSSIKKAGLARPLISFSWDLADHRGILSCQTSVVISPCLSSFPSKIVLISVCPHLYPIKGNLFLFDFETPADFRDQSVLPIVTVLLFN